MDVDTLTKLIPLGGTTVLFMLLLGWLMNERGNWITERKSREAAHVDEIDRLRKQWQNDIDNVRRDLEINLQQNRDRITELEADNKHLRSEIAALRRHD